MSDMAPDEVMRRLVDELRDAAAGADCARRHGPMCGECDYKAADIATQILDAYTTATKVGRCKDCEWFNPPYEGGVWGECLRASGDEDGEDYPGTQARARGMIDSLSGLSMARLETQPGFGCVMFEPKGSDDA